MLRGSTSSKQLGEFFAQGRRSPRSRVTGLFFGASGAGKDVAEQLIAGLLLPSRRAPSPHPTAKHWTTTFRRRCTFRRIVRRIRLRIPGMRRLFPPSQACGNLDYGRRMNRLADDPAQRAPLSPDRLDLGSLMEIAVPGNSPGG